MDDFSDPVVTFMLGVASVIAVIVLCAGVFGAGYKEGRRSDDARINELTAQRDACYEQVRIGATLDPQP